MQPLFLESSLFSGIMLMLSMFLLFTGLQLQSFSRRSCAGGYELSVCLSVMESWILHQEAYNVCHGWEFLRFLSWVSLGAVFMFSYCSLPPSCCFPARVWKLPSSAPTDITVCCLQSRNFPGLPDSYHSWWSQSFSSHKGEASSFGHPEIAKTRWNYAKTKQDMSWNPALLGQSKIYGHL